MTRVFDANESSYARLGAPVGTADANDVLEIGGALPDAQTRIDGRYGRATDWGGSTKVAFPQLLLSAAVSVL